MVHRAANARARGTACITWRQIIRFWKATFLCAFFIDDWLATSQRPVSIQLQPVSEDLPTNHRSFSNSYKTTAVSTVNTYRKVANQSLTSCKTYRRSYPYSKYGHKMVALVSAIASQWQWNQSAKRSYRGRNVCVTVALWLDWLIDLLTKAWLTDWLIDWSIDCQSVGHSFNPLIDHLFDWSRSVNYSVSQVLAWLMNWLVDWLIIISVMKSYNIKLNA